MCNLSNMILRLNNNTIVGVLQEEIMKDQMSNY